MAPHQPTRSLLPLLSTPMSTLSLTTTPVPTSPRTRRGTGTLPQDLTALPFLTAAPRLSPTALPTPMVDMSLMSATRVLPSTLSTSPLPTSLPQSTTQPQPTMLKRLTAPMTSTDLTTHFVKLIYQPSNSNYL